MKIKILSIAVLTGLTALIYSGVKNNQSDLTKASYQIRENNNNNASAKGAAEYWKMIRGSLEDGGINEEDYNNVMAQIENRNASRAGGIGLEFEPIGPTNIGGRTRGLVVDVEDPNIIYAAAVTGGVFKSLNGGNTWTTSFGAEKTLTTSFLTQASDGTLYLATGASSFELAGVSENGNSAPKEPGIGIMKSVNQGVTWTLLNSTEVTDTDFRFRTINEIKVSPTNPKIIAVATSRGLQVSFDAGVSWIDDLVCNIQGTAPLTGDINSIEFSLDGKSLWIGSDVGSFYYLDDLTATNSCGAVLALEKNGWKLGSARMKLSASTINPKKVYVALTDGGDRLIDLIESSDGGENFKSVNPNVPRSNPNFDLFGNAQAWYDLLFHVVPNADDTSRENIWLGGVDLWRYDGNWTQAAVGGRANGGHNPFFVHVDHHIMAYNKNNPKELYFGNDGGVFKTLDGGYEFFDINKGYMTTQFYSIDIANFDYAIGGTQDNGNIIVSPLRPGDTDFGAVVFNENITNGDGFDAVVSNIANVKYTSAQNSNVGRGLIIDVKGGAACGQYCGDSPSTQFYTKLALWESKDDKTSKAFIEFKADTVADAMDLGTGIRKTFSGTIKPAQEAAEVILESIEIGTIDNRLKYNGAGGFTGDGIGTFDEKTMEFSVTFTTPPQLNAKVNAYYASNYKAGSVLNVESKTASLPIQHVLNTNLEPGDVEQIQDPVQSLIAMTTSSECLSGESHNEGNCSGGAPGVLIGRDAININEELKWLFVPGGGGYRMVFSPDGDKLFTSRGSSISRLNGLNDVYTQADAYDVKRTTISGFSGTITGISLHPNDPETLIVTTGNYGVTASHVYIVTGALGASPVVKAVGGDLPSFPVYDAIFDMTNPERVILGTDKGVWTTNDVWAASPEYVEENTTIGRFPVIDVDQQTLPHGEASNREVIYLGTHGRGIWKSGTVVSSVEPQLSEVTKWESEIKLFPNPAKSNIQIEYTVSNPDEVTMRIFSIAGNVMKTITPSALEGENSINVPVNDLPTGTYFINMTDGNNQKVAKFIKM